MLNEELLELVAQTLHQKTKTQTLEVKASL